MSVPPPRSIVPATLLLLAALVAVSLLPGCGRAAAADETRLTVTGSSTVAPLVAAMAARYEAEHAGVRIDVQTGGSSKGIRDAREGLADIGMASRALTASEREQLATVAVAVDGIALIVHATNATEALTDDQVRAIYRGELRDWSAVGGAPGPITVVHKADGRATQAVFLEHFGLDPAQVAPDVVIGDNQQGLKTVAGSPGSVGYVSIGAAEAEAAAGAPIRLLATGGVPATTATVASGHYPIARPLNLVVRGPLEDLPAGLARDFLDFCSSTAVHDLVASLSYVPSQAPH